ncbi:MAG: GTPase HflX, partial [Candidatus Hydrogenedentota bacterium]
CRLPKSNLNDLSISIVELESLAKSVGNIVVGSKLFNLKEINPATFIGYGKVMLLREIKIDNNLDRIIFDGELAPNQQRNLAETIGCEVIDRTELILELFFLHAKTYEAKVQVELARLEYLLPRLRGRWQHLERQFGKSQIRGGPGEKQIELDRRSIENRILKLKERLSRIERRRITQRKRREEIFKIAIVGYTNAGKSTLFNLLTKSSTKIEDKLFTTLDPTTKRIRLPSGKFVVISDTVGFIRRLPHKLVESFKSTLEVVVFADFIIHLIDISNPAAFNEKEIVIDTLKELGICGTTILEVYNKIDKLENHPQNEEDGSVFISAREKIGIKDLIYRIDKSIL